MVCVGPLPSRGPPRATARVLAGDSEPVNAGNSDNQTNKKKGGVYVEFSGGRGSSITEEDESTLVCILKKLWGILSI